MEATKDREVAALAETPMTPPLTVRRGRAASAVAAEDEGISAVVPQFLRSVSDLTSAGRGAVKHCWLCRERADNTAKAGVIHFELQAAVTRQSHSAFDKKMLCWYTGAAMVSSRSAPSLRSLWKSLSGKKTFGKKKGIAKKPWDTFSGGWVLLCRGKEEELLPLSDQSVVSLSLSVVCVQMHQHKL